MQVLSHLDDSDQEALDLFNNLNPNPSTPQSPAPDSDDERQLGRLTKLKKDSKREKKKLKRKQKKMQRKMKEMEEGTLKIVTPLKKLKKHKRHHEEGSHSEAGSHDAGSSEFSSSEGEDKEDLQKELLNLNPDAAEQDAPSSPHRRLKRSGRKIRIEEKEGFRVEQLGNDPHFDLQKAERKFEDEDYSFDDIDRKTRKKRKPKPSVPTNEQIMERFKEQAGVVESDGEQHEGGYDNGLETLYSMKDKRKGAIRINNKLFCDLEIDPRNEQAVMPTPETLELELKPKTSRSSSCFSFLSKVESLKKQRGLQNSADQQEYERRMQERAKQSLAKVVTSMISQEFHEDIELEVRVPTIARGKSADIINNTVFLKSFASRCDSQDSPANNNTSLNSCANSSSMNMNNRKEGLTRQEFYRQIQEQTRKRRSRNISEAQLKESFKKTGLNQLEEARKRNQEKRRKEALSQEDSEEDEDFQQDSQHSEMDELLQKEERICGDREEEEQIQAQDMGDKPVEEMENNPAAQQSENQPQQVDFKVNLPEAEDQLNNQPEIEAQQENINEENEVIDELASVSHHQEQNEHELEGEVEEQEDEEDEQEEEEEENEEKAAMEEEKQLNEMVAMAEPNHQQQQKLMQLQEEGIMLRKRKQPDVKPTLPTLSYSQEPPEEPHSISPEDKENAISLPNTAQSLPQKPSLQTIGDQEEEFRNFKKLRKWAMVIAEKRKVREQGRRYAAEFLEQEAEEGSDNEDHDDMIKKIDYAAEEKEYEGVDLDADLVELIDNAVDLNEEDEQEAFRKYLEDIRIKDREEIRKIIRGEFRTRQDDDELDIGEDERRRQERMEQVMNWMKQREEEDGQGIYLKPPEEEQEKLYGSDSEDDYDRPRKQSKEPEEDDADRIPQAQEKAMIERFIENTLPSVKRDFRPTKTFDLGSLPESVKLDKGTNNKTIGLSRLASKNSKDSRDAIPSKLKKTSSLVNEIMNRTSITKISQKTLTGKLNKR